MDMMLMRSRQGEVNNPRLLPLHERYTTLYTFIIDPSFVFFIFLCSFIGVGKKRYNNNNNSNVLVLFTYSPVYLSLPLEALNAETKKRFGKKKFIKIISFLYPSPRYCIVNFKWKWKCNPKSLTWGKKERKKKFFD